MATEKGGMQVLESRFQLNDQHVWFGKAKLFADRVVLEGIGYKKLILLADIVEVRWASDELVIVTRDGEELDMTIPAAALWKYELQNRCGLKDAAQASSQDLNAAPLTNEPSPDKGLGDSAASSFSTPVAEPELRVNPPSSGDGFDEPAHPSDSEEKDAGQQKDMFLNKESTYRLRSSFAEDRPQHPKRGDETDR